MNTRLGKRRYALVPNPELPPDLAAPWLWILSTLHIFGGSATLAVLREALAAGELYAKRVNEKEETAFLAGMTRNLSELLEEMTRAQLLLND
jgi:hypothetical protein